MKSHLLVIMVALLAQSLVFALEEPENWGVGYTTRRGRIAFDTADSTVSDGIPLFYYKRKEFELRGSEYSVRLWDISSKFRLNLAGKYRFFDIPKSEQNLNGQGGLDYGVELFYHDKIELRSQLLFDRGLRAYVDIEARKNYQLGRLKLNPFAYFRYKSSRFNNHYFGRGTFNIGDGFELGGGIDLEYRLISHLHILASARLKVSESSTLVENTLREETRIGIAFKKSFSHLKKSKKKKNKLNAKQYLRLSYAWASPSDLNDIVTGSSRLDREGNRLIALSYGLPVSDNFLGSRATAYFTPMLKRHLSSDVQDSFNEYGIAFKVYIPVNIWKAKFRIGLAEGVTYTDDISFIEGSELQLNGFEPSRYLNYLDLSIGVNLGSITRVKELDRYWLGGIIHHRSGIFESTSVFGRIRGGSNYNGFYLLGEF